MRKPQLKTKVSSFYTSGRPDLSPEEVADIVDNSKSFRRLLTAALQVKLDRLIQADESEEIYETPNYEQKLADHRGARRQIRMLIRTISEGIPNGQNVRRQKEEDEKAPGVNAENGGES